MGSDETLRAFLMVSLISYDRLCAPIWKAVINENPVNLKLYVTAVMGYAVLQFGKR